MWTCFGLILCAQAGMGNMEAGNMYEMYGVAAGVIGGVSPLGSTSGYCAQKRAVFKKEKGLIPRKRIAIDQKGGQSMKKKLLAMLCCLTLAATWKSR